MHNSRALPGYSAVPSAFPMEGGRKALIDKDKRPPSQALAGKGACSEPCYVRMKRLPTALSTNPKSLPAREISCVRVALDVPLAKLFDYALPEEIAGARRRSRRGAFRRAAKNRRGDRGRTSTPRARRARASSRSARVRDDAPRLSADWLALMRFLSGYYQRPLGETVISALPPRLRSVKPLPKKGRCSAQTRRPARASCRAMR